MGSLAPRRERFRVEVVSEVLGGATGSEWELSLISLKSGINTTDINKTGILQIIWPFHGYIRSNILTSQTIPHQSL